MDGIHFAALLVFEQQEVQAKAGHETGDYSFFELFGPGEVLRGDVHRGIHDE